MLVWGINPCLELISSNPQKVLRVYITPSSKKRMERIIHLAEKHKKEIIYVEKKELDRISGTKSHQGVVCMREEYIYTDLEDMIKKWKKSGKKALFVALDGILDPQNLGQIIRCCECFGVSGIIITKDRCCKVNSTVAKVASGALEYVDIANVVNLKRALLRLKEEGVWIFGTVASGGESIFKKDLNLDIALVFGNEEKGLRKSTIDVCDFLLTIPTFGKVGSLNVTMACAISLCEVIRRRI